MFILAMLLLLSGVVVFVLAEWLERTEFDPHPALEELSEEEWEAHIRKLDAEHLQHLERDESYQRHVAREIDLMRGK